MTDHLEKIKSHNKILKIMNWIFGLQIIEFPMGKPRFKITVFYIGISIIIYCLLSGITYKYIRNANIFCTDADIARETYNIFMVCSIFIIVIMKASTFYRTEVSFLFFKLIAKRFGNLNE